jgi:hypothetical protein
MTRYTIILRTKTSGPERETKSHAQRKIIKSVTEGRKYGAGGLQHRKWKCKVVSATWLKMSCRAWEFVAIAVMKSEI